MQIVETAIVAGFGQQLGVGADFFYVPAIHHHDLIGRQNGGEPMGNRDHGLAGGEGLQRHLNLFFRFGIERGSGLVEKKDGRVLQNGARDGKALLLSAGQEHPFIANDGVVFLRLFQDEIVRISHLRCCVNFLPGSIEPAEKDVVVDGIVKQKCVLRHQADLLPQ